MEIMETRKLTAGTKALMVFAFAVMSGFMWRVRGDEGYGSMWGMFAVGVMFVLFIFAFFGNRRKMSYEAIPIAVILLGITNGSWGTLNTQMGGYLSGDLPFPGAEQAETVAISPFSGLWIMLLLGFGWMPLFSLFIGSLFSKKEYKLKHYLALIFIFYAVVLGFQFFAAHFIMPFINKEATEMFSKGLIENGIPLSRMRAYIYNFGSAAWSKTIPFGRNYFASIRAISYAAGALISSLAALAIMKDGITALISFLFNIISAVSITLADAFLIIDSDAGFLARVNAPAFLKGGSWSLWEYFTGFLLGFGMMLVLVCLPERITRGEGRFEYREPFAKKWFHILYSAVLTLAFTFGATAARPLGIRIAEQLAKRGLAVNPDRLSLIIIAAVCVLCVAVSFAAAKRNIAARGLPVPVPMRTEDFCLKAAPAYFGITGILYFFTGDAYILKFPFREIKNLSALTGMLRDGSFITLLIMILSFVLFYILYFSACKKAVRKK